MPIYEYRCQSCQTRFSVFFRSFSETHDPVCTHCGGVDPTRLISQVTFITKWNDGLPSWETMTDFDEDDPVSVARHMRRLKEDMGEDIGPEGEEMLAMMDAGEMYEGLGDMDDDGDWDF